MLGRIGEAHTYGSYSCFAVPPSCAIKFIHALRKSSCVTARCVPRRVQSGGGGGFTPILLGGSPIRPGDTPVLGSDWGTPPGYRPDWGKDLEPETGVPPGKDVEPDLGQRPGLPTPPPVDRHMPVKTLLSHPWDAGGK